MQIYNEGNKGRINTWSLKFKSHHFDGIYYLITVITKYCHDIIWF